MGFTGGWIYTQHIERADINAYRAAFVGDAFIGIHHDRQLAGVQRYRHSSTPVRNA
jgi:hypothetical protein